jgi:hypothetical protein
VDYDTAPLARRPPAVGKPEASAISNLRNTGFKIKTTTRTRTSARYGWYSINHRQEEHGPSRRQVVPILMSNVQRSPRSRAPAAVFRRERPKVSSGCGGAWESSVSEVADDHIRLRQRQTVALALGLSPATVVVTTPSPGFASLPLSAACTRRAPRRGCGRSGRSQSYGRACSARSFRGPGPSFPRRPARYRAR